MSCPLSPIIHPHTEPAKMTSVSIIIVEIVPLTRGQHGWSKQRRRRHKDIMRMSRNKGIMLHVTCDPLMPHAGTPDGCYGRGQRLNALGFGGQLDLALGRRDFDVVEVGR